MDPETPAADANEQAEEVVGGEPAADKPADREANEADVWEQTQEVPEDEDDR